MKLIIELSEKETATYADTISAFVRTIGGHGDPVVPVTHAAPIQIQAPAAPAPTAAHVPAVSPVPAVSDEEPATVSSNPPSVDATGLPWDERIHSATKSTVANGQWRRKKGVSDELVAQVEAELRGTVQHQTASPAPAPVAADPFAQFVQQTQQPAPVAAPAPIPQPMQAMPPLDAQQTAAFFAQQPAVSQPAVSQPAVSQPAVSQPAVSQPAQASAPNAPADFPSFMRVLAGAVASQKVDPAYINGLCQQLGIGAIADLMGNTALIPVAYNKLIADGKI